MNLRPLHPQCSGPEFEDVEVTVVTMTSADASASASPLHSETDVETGSDQPVQPDVLAALAMIERLPLSDDEKAEAVRRLLARPGN